MLEVQISLGSPDHSEAVALIRALDSYLGELYPAESNYLLDISELLAPNVRFVHAAAGDRIVGCGAVVLSPGYAELKRMFVEPASRRLGIGRRLLDVLEEIARKDDASLVRLETGVRQTEAIGFYERAGYQRIERCVGYRDDPNSVFFEKRLTK